MLLCQKEKKFATGCPAENNYAVCVKKKGQSTCAAAIDDSADTQAFNFFSNNVDSWRKKMQNEPMSL